MNRKKKVGEYLSEDILFPDRCLNPTVLYWFRLHSCWLSRDYLCVYYQEKKCALFLPVPSISQCEIVL